jgi:hypothetical protein
MRSIFSGFEALLLFGTLAGCSMSAKPLRQIPASDFLLEREHFLGALKKIAGQDAIDCGAGVQAIPCIRKAWDEHRPFTVTMEEFLDYCPNLNGYASDSAGNVYRVASCPNRDHKKGKVLAPTVELCESFIPPVKRFGDGQCSVLDSI